MAADSETSFWCLKEVTNTCKHLRNFWRDFFSTMAESWKKLKTSNVVWLFIVCSNRNRYALVHDLLSYNSQFVGQLYEDKSLALHTGDLIFFTTDLQTVNYYTTNHCQS